MAKKISYMIIKSAIFISSSPKLKDCPESMLPEFAFIGRSNVGKSSLINMITNIKNLAKTSSTPGKTQLINHFLINKNWMLADLPGIGYAKVSKKERGIFKDTIYEYILQRKNLYSVFMLIDSRLKPQKNDLNLINFMGVNNIPFVIVFTKTDKLSGNNKLKENINLYKKELLNTWEKLPKSFISSSKNHDGKKELLNFIQSAIN